MFPNFKIILKLNQTDKDKVDRCVDKVRKLEL